jgi:DNA-binding NarL/FixJ family response regulator
MAVVRVLVVDDYESFRRLVCSLLEDEKGLQVVGEASDGPEALEKVAELNPDIVLLDIGLPQLNGIETARQIRKNAPDCKIIFLTLERNPEMARAALASGALGYVIKVDLAAELLAAVRAVIRGERFVSSSLSGYGLNEPAGS